MQRSPRTQFCTAYIEVDLIRVNALGFALVILLSLPAWGAEIATDKIDGGSNVTILSSSIAINDNSSLRKTFYVMNDSSAPVALVDTGVETKYYDERYQFYPRGHLEAKQDVTAFELVFVLFDVFGDQMSLLKYTSVEDTPSGGKRALTGWASWYANENDVEEYLTSVSYLSKARLADGSLWEADYRRIGDEISRLGIVATAEELVPNDDDKQ